MRNRIASLPPDQPDPDLLNRLFFVQQVCLVLVIQIGIVSLCAHASAALNSLLPEVLTAMPPYAALAALLCAFALLLSEPGRSGLLVLTGRAVAAFAACAAGSALAERVFLHPVLFNPLALAGLAPSPQDAVAPATPAAFLLLAVIILLMRTRHSLSSIIADATACFLGLLVLVLGMEFLFGTFAVSPAITQLVSPQTLFCLVLLTVVALLRRTEYGVLSFFLGYGMGSRVGRSVLPVLFVLPFLREVGRARMISSNLIPLPYVTAILTSAATIISLGLLVFLAWYINRMQTEIQDLTLRDELTGLHNVRGFNLLAEQALLLARRANQEFGVLFIDLDDLKTINDHLGHSIGSATLVETARLLRTTFRETDVIARVGGDEFVVAGQFDLESISAAVDRLQACAHSTTDATGRRYALRLSMGYAAITSARETIKDLITRADQAMYQDKRQKKSLVSAWPASARN